MFHMEVILEVPPEDTTDRTDTTIVNLDVESGDIFSTLSNVMEQYYPAELVEAHIFLIEDEDEDDD